MTLVGCVEMFVVDIVIMVTVVKNLVTTSWAVHVLVLVVGQVLINRALVPVTFVLVVHVSVVQEVCVTPVLNRDVAALSSMVVQMLIMRVVLDLGSHRNLLLLAVKPGCPAATRHKHSNSCSYVVKCRTWVNRDDAALGQLTSIVLEEIHPHGNSRASRSELVRN